MGKLKVSFLIFQFLVLTLVWSESDFVVLKVVFEITKLSIYKLYNDPHSYVASLVVVCSWFDAIDEFYVKLLDQILYLLAGLVGWFLKTMDTRILISGC